MGSDISSPAKSGLEAQIEKYRKAVLDRNWDAWGATLAPDIFFSPPNQSPLSGRDATVAWIKEFPEVEQFEVDIEEIKVEGDLALVRGTYRLQVRLEDGTEQSDRGAFLDAHRRADGGSWPYTHVMFHSVESPPET